MQCPVQLQACPAPLPLLLFKTGIVARSEDGVPLFHIIIPSPQVNHYISIVAFIYTGSYTLEEPNFPS
jgi:hypothetical protein